jgi:hypothetical protein
MAEAIILDCQPSALADRAHDQRQSVAAVHVERSVWINPYFDQPAA